MHVVIIGAGAMGSRFGAALAKAEARVTLVDVWKEHVDAIISRGLEVVNHSDGTTEVWRVKAVTRAEDAGLADVVMLFTKTYNTVQAASSAGACITDRTLVITLQNGLGNREAVSQVIPGDRVLVGTTNVPSDIIGPGRILDTGSGVAKIMKPEHVDEVLEGFAGALSRGGIPTAITGEVFAEIWTKVAFNAVMNSLTAITRLKVGTVGGIPEADWVMRRVPVEVASVARSEGIEIDPEDVYSTLRRVCQPGQHSEHLPSMLQDVLRNRQTEIESINGEVVRRAACHGIDVPVTQALYCLVKMVEGTYGERLA